MRKLIVCSDGTWNTPDQLDQGVPAPTNVARISNAIVKNQVQKVYYHPGVGTGNSWWDKAIGGGTGTGLTRNILSAYEWLCRNYQQGDDIYLFGFSRGAYTVRSLSGFIARCGLLKAEKLSTPELWKGIELLYGDGYRERKDIASLRARIGDVNFCNPAGMVIPTRFIGVWDTVGSLGIPDDLGILNLLDNPKDHTFHNTSLGASVTAARHALAMDENRGAFQPTLWTNVEPDRNLKQVWFPGAHSDVGGGYRECGLADGALKWMIDEARETGLAFDEGICRQIKPNYQDTMHDPCTGLFALMPTQPRSIPSLKDSARFHLSALERHRDPPIHQCPYRRPHLAEYEGEFEIFARQQWNPTGLWLEAGVPYVFEASGEWLDSTISCGPGGTNDGKIQLGEFAHVVGSILGDIKLVFRKLSGNENAELKFTRRHERMPWFCLVGSIANGAGQEQSVNLPHEAFKIGTGCEYTPLASGYFYAYSNDAWNCYANNKGHVRLKVSRK
jgi:hypothetical protein